jgi:hypothetical protein
VGAPSASLASAMVGIGIIDIFERWEGGWWLQRAALSCLTRLTCVAPADAMTALPPRAYALRFEEFVSTEVLRVPRGERDVLLPSWAHLWDTSRGCWAKADGGRPGPGRHKPPDELTDCYA